MKKIYSEKTFFYSSITKKYKRFGAIFLMLLFLNASKSFAQIPYIWLGGTTDWTVSTNWAPARVAPLPNDILIFDNTLNNTVINVPTQTIGQLQVALNTTVSLQAAPGGNTLTISGGIIGDDLSVAGGAALNVNGTDAMAIRLSAGATGNIIGNMTFTVAAHTLDAADANGITFTSPSIFTQNCPGNVFTAAGTPDAIVFTNGTIFIKAAGLDPFALPAPSAKVVFNTGSLFKMQHNFFLDLAGRTYANLEVSAAGFNQNATGVGTFTVDNLTITTGILSVNQTGGTNIKGNISVAGGGQILSFNPVAANTLTFNGTANQSVTCAAGSTLLFTAGANEAIVFNNPAGVTFNSDVVFNNTVTFTSGVVTVTNPKILTLDATSSVAGASNASYVDGLVKKIGNTAFTFPIGKLVGSTKAYVPLQISAPGAITDEYTAEYKRNSAQGLSTNYAAGLDHVSGVDYWTLDRTSGSTPVNLTLFWTIESSANGSALYINDISKLRIAHFNSGIPQWDTYGVTSTTGGFAAGSITLNAVNVFSPFSLASTDPSNPLPINLNYLDGVKKAVGNFINWKVTCTNNPTATMVLERSASTSNFTAITTITADALRCQQPFDYTDTHPLPGINYYRLKMIDANGKITYSTIIALLNKETGFDIVNLMPSVVTSNAILNVTATQKTKMDIVITDITGRQVQKIAYNLIAGSNQFTLNLGNLNSGTYQINGYTADGVSKTIRFVKQ